MKKYICKKVTEKNYKAGDNFWGKARRAKIDCYPWKTAQRPYTPLVSVRLLYNENKIFVRFDVEEKNIRATYTKPTDPVCRDSCVEFFFSPCENDNRYLSFEINPLGALLIGIGTNGSDIEYLCCNREIFNISCYKSTNDWWVEYEIPFDFINQYFKEISTTWHGNFMKCADLSQSPHHGSWNLINTSIPMFHVPQFFGIIVLE